MKAIKYIMFISLILMFQACQKEESTLIDQRPKENITDSSLLTQLLARVAQNPTSKDNVLDSSSCLSVVLPVTVIVNGQNILVSSESDYSTVQQAIDAFSNDDDIVNFIFPITVKLKNFQTVNVLNNNQLDDLLDDCDENEFDEIECVDINFPLVINVYNFGSQTPTTFTFTSNSQLYNFLENLSPNMLASIVYPITVVGPNGQTITILNNSQLENVIDEAIDDCSNTSGGGGGGSGSVDFANLITSGNWRVTYYFDDTDKTAQFTGFNFVFNANGSSTATKSSTVINGSWSNFIDSGDNKFLLSYDGLTLDDIEEDWRIIEYNQSSIRLKDVSGGDGSVSYLTFTKN